MYKTLEKICEQCNKSYIGNKKRKYCSYICSKKARKKRVTLNCQNCNKKFEVQEWNKKAKFCSYDCKNKTQSSQIIDVTCDNCKNIFKRKTHKINSKNNFCCKDCANKFNIGANHYEWKEFLHEKNYKTALKQWALKIKERDGYICQLCKEDNKSLLEAHHIKHKSKYPELQFDFNNGITLCLKCHALQHINDVKALRLITKKMAAARKKK
jgi:hypothetical protein